MKYIKACFLFIIAVIAIALGALGKLFGSSDRRRGKKKQARRSVRPVWIILLIAVVACAAASGYYFWQKNKVVTPPEPPPDTVDNLKREELLSLKKNILVLGVDSRHDDLGRSDTLFVAMMDTESHHISLLSVPRDTFVRIPRYGWDKINHAYTYGGHERTRETVEGFLGIRIDNYVMVDFKGFKGIVDAVGGVDINVEKRMYYEDPWDDDGGLVIDFQPGMQHMNGEQAIKYVRFRNDSEGDFGRIKRQQQFVKALVKKVTDSNLLTTMPDLIPKVLEMVKTDLSLLEMATLAKAGYQQLKENGGAIQTARVEGDDVIIQDIYFMRPNMVKLREQMATMQGAQMTESFKQAAQRYEDEVERVIPELNALGSRAEDADKKEVKKPVVDNSKSKNVVTKRKLREDEKKVTPKLTQPSSIVVKPPKHNNASSNAGKAVLPPAPPKKN